MGCKNTSFCQDILNTIFIGRICNPDPQLVELGPAPAEPAQGHWFTPAREPAHEFSQPIWLSQSYSIAVCVWSLLQEQSQSGALTGINLPLHRILSSFQGLQGYFQSLFAKEQPQTAGTGNPCLALLHLSWTCCCPPPAGNREKDEDGLKKKQLSFLWRGFTVFQEIMISVKRRPHWTDGQPQQQAGRCQSHNPRENKAFNYCSDIIN